MLIVCPTCVSAYRVRPDAIAVSKGVVRCAHCREAWTVGDRDDSPDCRAVADVSMTQGSRQDAVFKPSASLNADNGAWIGAASPLSVRTTRPLRTMPSPVARQRSAMSAAPVALFVFALCAGMAVVGAREAVARALPASAGLFSAIGLPIKPEGLTLADVHTTRSDEGETAVLTVEGRIENPHTTDQRVPSLRIIMRDGAQQSVYTWTAPAPKSRLAPGEGVGFESRLVAPPESGHDLVVSFADTSAIPVGLKDKK